MPSNGKGNIANCSWGDHVVFGEGDGLLRTVESLERRMDAWREELGADTVHWRQGRTGHDDVYQAARGYGGKKRQLYPPITWDDFEVAFRDWPMSAGCGPTHTSRCLTRGIPSHRRRSARSVTTIRTTARTLHG